jgi:hypothetical protein
MNQGNGVVTFPKKSSFGKDNSNIYITSPNAISGTPADEWYKLGTMEGEENHLTFIIHGYSHAFVINNALTFCCFTDNYFMSSPFYFNIGQYVSDDYIPQFYYGTSSPWDIYIKVKEGFAGAITFLTTVGFVLNPDYATPISAPGSSNAPVNYFDLNAYFRLYNTTPVNEIRNSIIDVTGATSASLLTAEGIQHIASTLFNDGYNEENDLINYYPFSDPDIGNGDGFEYFMDHCGNTTYGYAYNQGCDYVDALANMSGLQNTGTDHFIIGWDYSTIYSGGDFSIAFWVRRTSGIGTDATLFSIEGILGEYITLSTDGSYHEDLEIHFWDGSGTADSETLTSNQPFSGYADWYHITFSYDSGTGTYGTFRLGLNGEQVSTYTLPYAIPAGFGIATQPTFLKAATGPSTGAALATITGLTIWGIDVCSDPELLQQLYWHPGTFPNSKLLSINDIKLLPYGGYSDKQILITSHKGIRDHELEYFPQHPDYTNIVMGINFDAKNYYINERGGSSAQIIHYTEKPEFKVGLQGQNLWYLDGGEDLYYTAGIGGTEDFSLSFWCNCDSTLVTDGIILSYDHSSLGYYFRLSIDSSGRPVLSYKDNSSTLSQTFTDLSITADTWHHYTIKVDKSAGTAWLYLDSEKSTLSLTGMATDWTSGFTLLTIYFMSQGIGTSAAVQNGQFAYYRQYSTLLADHEVWGLYLWPDDNYGQEDLKRALPFEHVSGFKITHHTDTDHDINIGPGSARSELTNGHRNMEFEYSTTKQIDATWAAGSDQGGMFTGSVAADTLYHVFIIGDREGNIDAGFDTSATCANIPTGYYTYKKIGEVFTDGSANIILNHGAFNMQRIELGKTSDVDDLNSSVAIGWDNTIYMNSAFSHDDSTNNERITINQDGRYHIISKVFGDNTGSGRLSVTQYIRKNGTAVNTTQNKSYSRGSGYGDDLTVEIVHEMYLEDGDYIDIYNIVDDADGSSSCNTVAANCQLQMRLLPDA